MSEFVEDPRPMLPSWNSDGCDACDEFSSGFPRGGGTYVNVSIVAEMGGWEEQAVLQASDRRSGDRFGSSLSLDKVGATPRPLNMRDLHVRLILARHSARI